MNKSIDRAFKIIDLIAIENRQLSLSEIKDKIKMPKTTTFDILQSLVDLKILKVTNDDKLYSLGIKLLTLGTKCLLNIDLRKIAHEYIEETSAKTKSICFLAIENNGEITYLDKTIHTGSALQPIFEIGMQAPMHSTGLGKALLASYEQEKAIDIVKTHGLSKKTPNTIIKISDLKKELSITRERGYAIDDEENEEGIFCVAAPIYDHFFNPVAAISIVTIKSTLTEKKLKTLTDCIISNALNISKDLGYTKTELY